MYFLRTKPPQYPKGKTEETLCDLAKRYLLNSSSSEYHLIDIVVTNNKMNKKREFSHRKSSNFCIPVFKSKWIIFNDSKSFTNVFVKSISLPFLLLVIPFYGIS